MLRLKKTEQVDGSIDPDGCLVLRQGRQEVRLSPGQCKSLSSYLQINLKDQLEAWEISELAELSHPGFEG